MAGHEEMPVRSKRWALTLVLAVVGVGALVALTMFWSYPTTRSMKQFDVAKITNVHVDEEPFGRLALAPGESYRAIELMQGTEAEFKCETVSVAGTPRFLLKAFGKEHASKDCRFKLTVPDEVGVHHELSLSFWDGDATEPTDTMAVPVVVVVPGERIEFHAIEDERHQPVKPIAVPDKVYVYARAITQLPLESREYSALFFTADPRNNVPVLELMPVKAGEEPQPMLGQVVRFRRYGDQLSGYAFWSPLPVNIGGKDQDRKVVDVYVGIFPREDARQILPRLLKIDQTGTDTVTVTPLVQDVQELRKMTVGGKLLSEPLHLLRAGAGVRMGVNPTPVAPPSPAAEAPAPATAPGQ